MAVCPKCAAGVGLGAAKCPHCGAPLQLVGQPDAEQVEALKEDIEEFVHETAPEDSAEAAAELEQWRPDSGAGAPEVVSTARDAEPVAVYDAPDETSARLVASLLESGGLDALVMSHTMPMLDTARRMEEGIWGQVLVHHQDAGRARELLAAYETGDADGSP